MDRLMEVLDFLKKELPFFEARDEQLEMMKSVYHSMLNNEKVAVHAPTGTGKSLGYLIPFLAVKLDKPEFKLTVSTFTISLQEQLVRDIDMIKKIYEKIKFKHAFDQPALKHTVLKGKSNYFCEDRFVNSSEIFPVNVYEMVHNRLFEMHSEQTPLDRQHFQIPIRNDQWSEISVESCKKEECPFHKQCTFYKDYFIQKSDIVIVNHSLFFNRHFFVEDAWDDYHFHVFDEAHKLEKVILSSSTFEISPKKLEAWVLQGANLAYRYKLESPLIEAWMKNYLYSNSTVLKFKKGMANFATKISGYSYSIGVELAKKKNFIKMVDEIVEWQKEMFEQFKSEVAHFQDLKEDDKLKEEINFWGMNLLELAEFNSSLNKENTLLWSEKADDGTFVLKVTPKNIHEIPSLFEESKGILLTSGTLAINGSCSAFANRLNITLADERILPTPFDLKENTLCYISRHVNPKSKSYFDDLENEIFSLLKAGEMKTFILFTSVDAMNKMHERLASKIRLTSREKVEVWLQDKNNYQDVVASFENESVRSVLFGTLTYFEGIDLKGEKLTQIILTRLPFSVPDHPIQELLEHNKGYSQWEAFIRFEQAFGRLIRTTNDYGTFSVLDNRYYNFSVFSHIFNSQGIRVTNNIEDISDFYKQRKK